MLVLRSLKFDKPESKFPNSKLKVQSSKYKVPNSMLEALSAPEWITLLTR